MGLRLADEADVIGLLGLRGASLNEIHDEIWPPRMYLPRDPRCSFAMLRGGFVYMVRGGVLRTVIRGQHYEVPGRVAPGDDLS